MAGIEYLSPEGLRVDGRRPHELRKLQCQVGVFKQADGSSFLEQGNTKVLASVYGPHDVSQRSQVVHDRAFVNCQFSMASFSTSERKKRAKGDRRAVELSQSLKQTFESTIMTELFPHSEININVQVLQSDGGDYSASVNAATMALIDAGIPMKDYVCACSASYVEDTPILDINYLEETAGGPQLNVATLPNSGKIVLLRYLHNPRTTSDLTEMLADLAKQQSSQKLQSTVNTTIFRWSHDYIPTAYLLCLISLLKAAEEFTLF